MQVVIFSSPGREDMLTDLMTELNGFDIHVINDAESFGKRNFWKRWKQARQFCLNSKYNEFLIFPDDITCINLKAIKEIFKKNTGLFVCSVINDGRDSCWGVPKRTQPKQRLKNVTLIDKGFFDCGGLINRKTLESFEIDPVKDSWFNSEGKSSGVGHQITVKLRRMGIPMYVPSESMCYHGAHDSVMHYHERKKNPLVTHKPKVIIAIATFKGREESIKKTIASLASQADSIRIYNNEERDIDLTDNGKFYFLQEYSQPIYYLTCDDDIIYPPTYVEDMVKAIDKYKCIITHHGRKLLGLNRSYYRDHRSYSCLKRNDRIRKLDVAGTGVTGFRTDQFNPSDIWQSKDKRMSDLVFSLEARKQKKEILLIPHTSNYFTYQNEIQYTKTICGQDSMNDKRQSEIADLIFRLQL